MKREHFTPKYEKIIPGMKQSIYKLKESAKDINRQVYTMCFGKKYFFSLDEAAEHSEGLVWHFV